MIDPALCVEHVARFDWRTKDVVVCLIPVHIFRISILGIHINAISRSNLYLFVRGNINLTCFRYTSIYVAGVDIHVYFWGGVFDVVSNVGVEPVSS